MQDFLGQLHGSLASISL